MNNPEFSDLLVIGITSELAMFDTARRSRNYSSERAAVRSARIITPSRPISLFNNGEYLVGEVMDLHAELLMQHSNRLQEQGKRRQLSYVSGQVFELLSELDRKYARIDLPFLDINIDKLPALQNLAKIGYVILDPHCRRMNIR